MLASFPPGSYGDCDDRPIGGPGSTGGGQGRILYSQLSDLYWRTGGRQGTQVKLKVSAEQAQFLSIFLLVCSSTHYGRGGGTGRRGGG